MTRVLLLAALAAACIACLPEPPSDSEIEAYFALATRCERDPTDVACCSRTTGRSAAASVQAGTPVGRIGWTPLLAAEPESNVEQWRSQLPLDLARGAALDLEVGRIARTAHCGQRGFVEDETEGYVKLELGTEISDDTWIAYSQSGLLTANLAGQARIHECMGEAIRGIQLDLRPGMFGLEEVLYARVGIVPRSAHDELDATRWLSKDVALGPMRSFLERRHVTLSVRGSMASTRALTQLQGSCASAAQFEPIDGPLGVTMLGVQSWAATIGELALLVGPAENGDSWELLFSGERATEPGVARRRSLGYCKRFDDDLDWVAIPNSQHALLGPAAVRGEGAETDVRSPALALSKFGERVIGYIAGEVDSYVELGYLSDSGVDVVRRIPGSSIAQHCVALAHPALVALPDDSFVLYATCCATTEHECGTGEGEHDAIWRAYLTERLELVETGPQQPREVTYDSVGRKLTQDTRLVGVEAVYDPRAAEVRLWLLVQREFQERALYLARSSEAPYDFVDLHSNEPVLIAQDLCPESDCTLEGVAIASAADARSVRLLALSSSGVVPALTQHLHLLKQSLEVPW